MDNAIKIDMKVLNTIIKAIDVHLDVINNSKVYAADGTDKLQRSLEHLISSKNELQNEIEKKDIKTLKRNAYKKYLDSKKEYNEALKNGDEAYINKCREKKELLLEHYIAVKELN